MHALHFEQSKMTTPLPNRIRSRGARGGKARLESNQLPQSSALSAFCGAEHGVADPCEAAHAGRSFSKTQAECD